ncbi:CoA pyrophosphatase [Glacieibacterium sp.]|uniref:CoA pyrophosphatase n=1 Tax=Glacieibacterium sp. TaxID=2860237 RepID=UPI003AFFD55A
MTLAERLRPAVGTRDTAYSGDWAVSSEAAAEGRVLTDAAVLIAIIERTRPTLLLTRRNAAMRRHAGQVAFPGGRIDPGDASPTAAALREAHEEVALPPEQVNVIGTTDLYETGTGFSITPVIGIIPPGLPLVPAEAEVAALFEVDLEHVLDPVNHQLRTGEWQGKARRYYVIRADEHEIWGATAAMIVNLSRRLA